jgi:transposase
MLADQVDYVIGVDTHRDEHVLAVVAAATGAVVAQRSVATTSRGYAQAFRFAADHAPAARVWAVEGAGHYGVGLARDLSGRGEAVLEAPVARVASVGCKARTTNSTLSGRPGRCSPQKRWRCHAKGSNERLCGC